jgi:hypothetical protein
MAESETDAPDKKGKRIIATINANMFLVTV